jgi:cell division protein ZapB
MQSELDALEQKLLQLVQLNQRLRAENQQLRQHVAAALNEQRKRQDKIDQAAQRLERLLDQLPAETP